MSRPTIDADDLYEAFEERAAIMEFDAAMTRSEAESAAMALLTGDGNVAISRRLEKRQ